MLKRRTLIHHSVLTSTASLTLSLMKTMNYERLMGRGHPMISKRLADYQTEPHQGHCCAACCMFVPGRSAHCTMIEGVISPHGWCKYWQAGRVDTCS